MNTPFHQGVFPPRFEIISGLCLVDADLALLPRMQPAVPERGAPGGRMWRVGCLAQGSHGKNGQQQQQQKRKTHVKEKKRGNTKLPLNLDLIVFSIFLTVAGRHTIL